MREKESDYADISPSLFAASLIPSNPFSFLLTSPPISFLSRIPSSINLDGRMFS